MFEIEENYYDLLELQTTASTQDIRVAYQRLKSTYRKDNLALYSLMDDHESGDWIKRIDTAYDILSDPEKRRHYDLKIGLAGNDFPGTDAKPAEPFLEQSTTEESEEDLLIAPKTDFIETKRSNLPPKRLDQLANFNLSVDGGDMDALCASEKEWHGSFIRRLREFRRLTLDDVTATTRISKNYLNSIEEENYEKLPAAVFVRGFVAQYAKVLRAPPTMTTAYMSRFKKNG